MGNVKIPTMETFNLSEADPDGWFKVQTTVSSPEEWTSLMGLPLVGLPAQGISNFSLESTYLSVQCGNFTQTPYPGGFNVSDSLREANLTNKIDPEHTNWTTIEGLAPGEVWYKKSAAAAAYENPFRTPLGSRASFFMDTTSPWMSSPPPMGAYDVERLNGFFGNINQSTIDSERFRTNRELIYVSLFVDPNTPDSQFGLNIAKCSLRQNHIEALVRCDNQKHCVAEKVRKSLSDTRPTSLTGFEHHIIALGFMREFPVSFTSFTDASSPTERFLANTSAFPFVQQTTDPAQDVAYVNLSITPPEVFSRRLSLVMNTYYQLSTQPTGYFGSLSANLSKYGPDTAPVTDINAYLPKNLSATEHSFDDWWSDFQSTLQVTDSPFIGATTTAGVTTTEEIFSCNVAWLAILFTSSVIIFITGVVALVLKRKTLGPELFGFVTSMTYDNPYVKIADGMLSGGTAMDAMERARLLKDVKVYIGDVRGNDDVGHIAMAAGVPLRKLEKGRLYS